MALSILWRVLGMVVPLALVVLALVFPDIAAYLWWPLFAAYLALSYRLFCRLSDHRWVFRIVSDRATRVAHALEHATISILAADRESVLHGFTHHQDRFVVAVAANDQLALAEVENVASQAIRRIQQGEHSLAYVPGCGTSVLVSAFLGWFIFVPTLVLTILLGGSTAFSFALVVIVHGLWIALHEPLGLMAQRLFTVSTTFESARVIAVRERDKVAGMVRPVDERWFEVIVETRLRATEGGLISPGHL